MMESGEIDQDLLPAVKEPKSNGHVVSPDDVQEPTDSDSNSHSFVTLSPPMSPGEQTGLIYQDLLGTLAIAD